MKKLLALFILLLLLVGCNKKQDKPLPEKNDSIAVQEQLPEHPHKYVEPAPRIGVRVGTVGDKDVFYDEYGSGSYTIKFVVYIKGATANDTLLVLSDNDELEGNYVSSAEVLTIKDKPFIYVNTDHTYGHSKGFLYAVNISGKKAYPVKVLPDAYKIPDSLLKGHVVSLDMVKKEDNSFSFDVYLHGINTDYTYSGNYKLVDEGNWQYVLKPYGRELYSESGQVIKIE